jgi:uroporphyrinogen-III decarboxylase
MSYEDGWAALNLKMPPRVPRTEYSVELHWGLITAVTGIPVDFWSSEDEKRRARSIFYRSWNLDLFWRTLIDKEHMPGRRTSMGHAVYEAGGTDFDPRIQCPFSTPEEALAFDPMTEYGIQDKKKLRTMFENDYLRVCREQPDGVNMTGIYITCLSGLIYILGWEMLLLAAGTDPVRFGELTNRYCGWVKQHFEALAQADVPVVMVHDDIVWSAGPFLHPDWYRRFVFPNYKKLFAPLLESGKRVLFTSDGDYTMFLEDLVACGSHGFFFEPLTDMAAFAERYGRTHVFVGNADTRILLSGSQDAIRREVKRCLDIGKKYPGFFMAVGNHIPPNTPVENALYCNACYEEMSRR